MQPEVKWIMEYLDERPVLTDMQNALDDAYNWMHKVHSYESKMTRIREYRTSTENPKFALYDVMCHIFAGTILHPEGMTYQAMIGYISGNIGCKDPLDRAKCAAELIAMAFQADLIVITKVSDKTMMITTEYELEEDVPSYLKHAPHYRKPEPVSYNPILGNKFKQHDKDICVEHLDRLNATPLSLEMRIIYALEETTSTELETTEQEEQWQDFVRRSQQMYFDTYNHSNKFYLEHKYDTRGRTYCSGYYINYQGSAYKKAIVQLADKEIVKL